MPIRNRTKTEKVEGREYHKPKWIMNRLAEEASFEESRQVTIYDIMARATKKQHRKRWAELSAQYDEEQKYASSQDNAH